MTNRHRISPEKHASELSRRELVVRLGAGAVALSAFSSPLEAQTKPLFAFSNKSLDYYFFVILQESAKRAAEAQGWEFQATNANFDATAQNQQWETMLLKQPIAIMGASVDSDTLISAIKKSKSAGVPVALVDSLANGGEAAIAVAFDNYQGGVMAAEKIIELVKKKYNGEEKGIVLNCYGSMKSDAVVARKKGWDTTFAKYPGIKMIERPTDGFLDQMLSVTANTLSEFPTLDAVHAPSDSPARGIVTALKQKGRWQPVGHPDHVIFVNIDGEPIGLQWVRDGYMDADISQDPIAYCEIAIDMLVKYTLKGQAVPLGPYVNDKYYWEKGEIVKGPNGPRLILPPFVVDKSNVDDKRQWGNIALNVWGIKYS